MNCARTTRSSSAAAESRAIQSGSTRSWRNEVISEVQTQTTATTRVVPRRRGVTNTPNIQHTRVNSFLRRGFSMLVSDQHTTNILAVHQHPRSARVREQIRAQRLLICIKNP